MTILVDEILVKLDTKTRGRVQAAIEVQLERQETPSIGLNLALRGLESKKTRKRSYLFRCV